MDKLCTVTEDTIVGLSERVYDLAVGYLVEEHGLTDANARQVARNAQGAMEGLLDFVK